MTLRKLRMRPKRLWHYVGGGDYTLDPHWHFKGGRAVSRAWLTNFFYGVTSA
ncbi:hypothetical protein [Cupriavidus sp. RAF12]|uniref:hypothetical protein n=1 Tax=Cupriavidus sp. RAF12 TaxID=3233050 RepID=UPI003F8DE10E